MSTEWSVSSSEDISCIRPTGFPHSPKKILCFSFSSAKYLSVLQFHNYIILKLRNRFCSSKISKLTCRSVIGPVRVSKRVFIVIGSGRI